MSVCTCGHVNRMHPESGCTACGCRSFVAAADPVAAIEAARVRAIEQHRLLGAARTALARGRYDEALAAVLELLNNAGASPRREAS